MWPYKDLIYLRLNFSILLSYVFKAKTWLQIGMHIYVYSFLCSFSYLLVKHNFVYNDVKLCHQIDVFTPEYLNANNKFHKTFLSSRFTPLTISKLQQINNKSFYRLLITLSVDLSLNPAPVCKHEILKTMEWDISETKG